MISSIPFGVWPSTDAGAGASAPPLRDGFALAIMIERIKAEPDCGGPDMDWPSASAAIAYKIADAMLAARARGGKA